MFDESDLLYITGARLGNKSANNVHVAQISQELERIFDRYHLFGRSGNFFGSAAEVQKYFSQNLSVEINSEITLSRRLPFLTDRLFSHGIHRVLKKYKYGRVYSRSIEGCDVASRFQGGAPSSGQLRIVLELHEPPAGREIARFESLVSRDSLHAIVCISANLKEVILQRFPQITCEVFVIHDGAQPNEFSQHDAATFLRRFNLPDEFVGYTGHLYEGRADFIMTLAEVMPYRSFVLMGGEEDHVEAYRIRVQERGLNNIVLLGHRSQREVQAFNRTAMCLTMPYTSDSKASGNQITAGWMSPLKMFEYMTSGTPIISSDLPVLREVLNESNAFIHDLTDVQAWVDSINCCFTGDDGVDKAAQARRDVGQYLWPARALRIKVDVFGQ